MKNLWGTVAAIIVVVIILSAIAAGIYFFGIGSSPQ
ncbi:flagellar basal body-associated protein FliL [Paenibacillus sp. LBL]|nr:flagellar basal body-associated protein FliL [Paenibacillus sp. LBL]